ncbi:MAG TPA: phosphatidylglycerol lysyltransferase domain-containing protein [Candidatus Eisenbacteria bacterium]
MTTAIEAASPLPVAPRSSTPPARARDQRVRLGLSLAVAVQGLIDLFSALLSHPPDRLLALRRLVPTTVIDSSRTFTLLAGVLLLITAWGLRRGKRRAFVAALFLCALSVPVNLLKAIDFEEATAASVLLFALGVSGDAFRVKSRELTLGAVSARAVLLAAGLAVYAVAGSYYLEAHYGHDASIGRAVAEAAYRLFGIGSPALHLPALLTMHAHRIVTWFFRSLGLIGFSLLVGVALAALRPVAHRGRHRAERARVATLLREHGDSSIGAFALDPDCDYFFSATGRAVVAYRFESNVLLVLGDPIGPEEEQASLLAAFEAFCRDHDWSFAFFQARTERLGLYRARGWRAIHIGEDPILPLEQFSLEGSAMGDVRRSLNRLREAGYQVRSYFPDVNPFDGSHEVGGLRDQIGAISAEWLRSQHGGEKGFAMGRFDTQRLRESWLAVAWDPSRLRADAFVTWVPVWGRRGWALDLMRRRANAPPGCMEFLVASCAEAARARGDALLSLSLSALVKAEGDGAEPADRARSFLMEHLARFYDFQGLFRWKSKFQPEFEPRYLVYPDPLSLPRVALALVRAQSPGGLLTYFRRAA